HAFRKRIKFGGRLNRLRRLDPVILEHQSQTIVGAGRESGEQDAPSLPDLLRQMPAERLVDIYRRSFLLRRLARLGPFRGKVTARPAAHVDNDGLAAADGLER